MTEPREGGEKQKPGADAPQPPTFRAVALEDLELASDDGDDIRGGTKRQELSLPIQKKLP